MEKFVDLDRIQREEFKMAGDMTTAVARGQLRGLVIQGPPGLGKSFTVYNALEAVEMEKQQRNPLGGFGGRWDAEGKWRNSHHIIKTMITPPALHSALYTTSGPAETLVLDDCDSVFRSEEALNILKSALDTGAQRLVSWVTARKPPGGAPSEFYTRGGIIMITNVDFDEVRNNKLREHVEALEDRCYVIKFSLKSNEAKFARIWSLINNDGFLSDRVEKPMMIFDYMWANQDRFDEISLRTALKIADLIRLFPSNWPRMVEGTMLDKN